MHILNGVSFFFLFKVFGCRISCLLQVNGNGNIWCYICVSNVKVVDEPSSCFGAFDDLCL
jgi:hypothetical protein